MGDGGTGGRGDGGTGGRGDGGDGGTGGRGDGGTGGRGDGGTGGRVPPLVKAGGGGIFNLCKLPVAQSWGLGRQDKFALGSDESKSTNIFIR